jgi:energy-coupling factor transporter ATP-binding protein EcfA2
MLGHNTLEQLLQKLIINNRFDDRLIKSFEKKLKSHQINWTKVKNKRSFDLSWSAVRIILVIMLSLSNFSLIVLDEPTFGLGFQQKIRLSQILKSMLVNKHLILVSHDTNFIQNHCDQIIDFDTKTVLQNKKILASAK